MLPQVSLRRPLYRDIKNRHKNVDQKNCKCDHKTGSEKNTKDSIDIIELDNVKGVPKC